MQAKPQRCQIVIKFLIGLVLISRNLIRTDYEEDIVETCDSGLRQAIVSAKSYY